MSFDSDSMVLDGRKAFFREEESEEVFFRKRAVRISEENVFSLQAERHSDWL